MCECFVNHILYICFILSACYQPNTITTAAVFFVVYYLFSNDNIVLCRRHHDCSHLTSHLWRNHLLIYDICMCVYMYIYIYIFLFGNTWLIAWHVSYLDYMGGPYESGSHCNQCKDLPTFSTVLFCCLHYCINVIYYVLFCLINYFQVSSFKFQWLYPLTGLKSRIVTISHMKINSKYMVIYTDIHTRSHQLPQEPVPWIAGILS